MTGAASVIPNAADVCIIRSEAAGARVAARTEKWILAATILGSGISAIDGTAVNVVLPIMQRSLGATAADLQWVIEGYSLFLASLILVGGALGDRLGRRRVFAVGIVIFTVASATCAIAPTVEVIIAARCLQGVGGALLIPGSLAIISASFEPARRGMAIGTWTGFSSITTAGFGFFAVLGLVVAATFASKLDSRLDSLHVSPAVKTALDAQRSKYVDAPVPGGLPPAERAGLHRALKEAFVSSFRASTLIGAALAVGSALLAAWLIDGSPPKEGMQPQFQRTEAAG